jgi:hypothetical protein
VSLQKRAGRLRLDPDSYTDLCKSVLKGWLEMPKLRKFAGPPSSSHLPEQRARFGCRAKSDHAVRVLPRASTFGSRRPDFKSQRITPRGLPPSTRTISRHRSPYSKSSTTGIKRALSLVRHFKNKGSGSRNSPIRFLHDLIFPFRNSAGLSPRDSRNTLRIGAAQPQLPRT